MKYALYTITLFLLALVWNTAWAQVCQSATGGYCASISSAQVSIPGFEGLPFSGAKTIGELLSGLYIFGVGLAALAAFIMFTIGGIAYLTAGDNESQVTKAKGFMKNAVFGLALALLSWLILFTINPDLVKTLDLKLEPIKGGAKSGPSPGTFGGSNVGDTRVETGVGQVTVQNKLTGVDQCIPTGQAQIQEFCKKCIDGGGQLCKRADNKPIGQCIQDYMCLK